jgi:hypothetical protein
VTSLRLPLRLANCLVRCADRLRSRPMFAITPEEVKRIAMRASGVADFDGQEFGEPLQRLCDTLVDARFTPLYRMIRRSQIIGRATMRLLIERALRADPGIANEPIQAPWFVTGLPRTGTTLLHRVLAQDPQNRAPLFWETLAPIGRSDHDTPQRRQRRVRTVLRLLYLCVPGTKAQHEVAADLPEECNPLLACSLVSGFWLICDSNDFVAWQHSADKAPAYRLHKLQLQFLQHNSDRRTWVLKAPFHMNNLHYLQQVYPDARVIHLHRDPVEVVGSLASYYYSACCVAASRPDAHDVGDGICDYVTTVTGRGQTSKQARDWFRNGGLQIIDVRYPDLVADPLGVIDRIYARFGCVLSEGARARMAEYLRRSPSGKYGAHRYTLEQFGIDRERLRTQCSAYIDKYLQQPVESPF